MDISYLLWLQSIREGASPIIKALFTFLGSKGASVALVVIPCLVYWCLNKRVGMFAICAYGTSFFCNQLIKNTVCQYRPWVRDSRIVPDAVAKKGATGYSFPSTHTQSSTSLLLGLGWKARERSWPLVLGLALVLLIGFSRNFLGVHTPQDVIVAFAEGCLFIWLTDRLMAWVDEDDSRVARVALAGVLLAVPYLAFITLKPYPMDYVDGTLLVDPAEMMIDCYKAAGTFVGICLGWYVEHRFVRFDTGGLSLQQTLARMVVGVVCVLFFYLALGQLFKAVMGLLWGNFVRHLLAFYVAIAGVPVCFERLDRAVAERFHSR